LDQGDAVCLLLHMRRCWSHGITWEMGVEDFHRNVGCIQCRP
jgi:hypothetical protein